MVTEPATDPSSGRPFVVGVISDTHGYLYPEVKQALQGVDHIIHAGDIGSPQVLAELRAIAPVTAVRGNCDYDEWAQNVPARAELTLAGARLTVGHVGWQIEDRHDKTSSPPGAGGQAAAAAANAAGAPATAARPDVLVFGHSHQSLVEWRQGVLYLNPGAAGPRRFNRPRSLARLTIVPVPGGESGSRPRIQADILIVD